MSEKRKIWRGNEHITISYFNEVQIGDVVDHVDVAPKVCPVLYGDPSWHILLTVPQAENKAAENLKEAGFRARSFRVWRREATGKKDQYGRSVTEERERAMFPGYIFCDLRSGIHDFKSAVSVKGIRDFLRREGMPCSIPGELFVGMEESERFERERYLESVGPKRRRRSDLEIGESVMVTEGPFAQFIAQVAKLDDRGRVQLLISMLGGQTKAWMDGRQLEKL